MAYRLMEVAVRTQWLYRVGSMICTLLLPLQVAAFAAVPAGRVASHGLERDVVNADGTGEGAGYFTFIEGIPGPFFAGSPGEGTAFFTFRTAPFSTQSIQNGRVAALLHSSGRFTIYLNSAPHGSWNSFDTLSQGARVAVLEFGTTQDVSTGSVQIGYTPARLVESTDFEFQGRRFNFGELFPNGVTIAFTVNPTPLNTTFPLVFSLGFTSFAIGTDTEQTE